MGRVAKYKKIKSFDPYSSKNGGTVNLNNVGIWGLGDNGVKEKKRSKRSEMLRRNKAGMKRKKTSNGKDDGGVDDGNNNHKKKSKKDGGNGFDLPPTNGDEFDMNDIVGSVKKQKLQSTTSLLLDDDNKNKNNNNSLNTTAAATTSSSLVPLSDKEERKVSRILRIEQQVEQVKKQKVQDAAQRLPGESKRSYNRRTKTETRQIMQKSKLELQNPEKRQKKKDFLTAKKKNGKKKSSGSNGNNEWNRKNTHDDNDDHGDGDDIDDDDDSDDNVETDNTRMVFGEQVERPPVFQHLPRGAKLKQQSNQMTRQQGNRSQMSGNPSSKKGSSSNTTTMTDAEIEAEHHAMDLLRRKVQAQYAAVKASRRRTGDFHL